MCYWRTDDGRHCSEELAEFGITKERALEMNTILLQTLHGLGDFIAASQIGPTAIVRPTSIFALVSSHLCSRPPDEGQSHWAQMHTAAPVCMRSPIGLSLARWTP